LLLHLLVNVNVNICIAPIAVLSNMPFNIGKPLLNVITGARNSYSLVDF